MQLLMGMAAWLATVAVTQGQQTMQSQFVIPVTIKSSGENDSGPVAQIRICGCNYISGRQFRHFWCKLLVQESFLARIIPRSLIIIQISKRNLQVKLVQRH